MSLSNLFHHMRPLHVGHRIALTLILSLLAVSPSLANDGTMSGTGSETDPYIIHDAKDWETFANEVNNGNTYKDKFIKLDWAIFVSQQVGSHTETKVGNMIVPIDKPFSGTFDGNGRTIHADITESDGIGTALFGCISGATIKNLTVTGEIHGGNHAAGLVGVSVGSGNKIQYCVVYATIYGGTHLGGILGHGGTSSIEIESCVFSGLLDGGSIARGAFIGWGDNGGTKSVKYSLCIPQKGVQAMNNFDLVQMNGGTVTVTDCYKTENIGDYGILVYLSVLDVPAPDEGFVTGKIAYNGTTFYLASRYIEGKGSRSNPYVIRNEEGWDEFAQAVSLVSSFEGKYVKLGADISTSQKAGLVKDADLVNPFSGVFDGNGHTITANIYEPYDWSVRGGVIARGIALFRYINGATIKNLTVAGHIAGGDYVAGLVGYSKGAGNRIDSCVVSATVSGVHVGSAHVGGILGNGTDSDIEVKNSIFKGSLEGSVTKGAIIGWSDIGGTKSVNSGLYIFQEEQDAANLDLVYGEGSVEMSDTYHTADFLYFNDYGRFVTLTKPVVGATSSVEKTVMGVKCYLSIPEDDEGYYLNMPKSGVHTAEIVPGVTLFKLYDDGGKNGNYGPASGSLLVKVPEGYRLYVTGNAVLSSDDKLSVRDGGTDGRKLMDAQSGTINGIELSSTGNVMAFSLESNNKDFAAGLDLTVAVVEDIERTVLCKNADVGGTVSCNKAAAKLAEKVTMMVTPPQGYSVYGYQITGDGYDKTVVLDGTHFEETAITFRMPPISVTVTPKFIKGWRGDGSKGNPYIISDANDWDFFVSAVNGGNSFAGKFVKLTSNIVVNRKLGVVLFDTPVAPFSGTFDGDGYTITAAIEDKENYGTALFSYIEGATIKNLVLAGNITGGEYAAGLVGYSKGTWVTNKIEDCSVTATVAGESYIGGILGHAMSSSVEIENCVFKGLLVGEKNAKGVFVGWSDKGGSKTVKNCLYVAQEGQSTENFDMAKITNGSVTDCYRTSDVGSYCLFVYPSKSVALAVDPTAILDEMTAADGSKFYSLTGFTTGEIPVYEATTAMNDGVYKVYRDVSIGERIGISGDVKIILNEGVTLNAVKGIDVGTGSKLTIDGKGAHVSVGERIGISGDVKIILDEGVMLNAAKGIDVGTGSWLTINGKGTHVSVGERIGISGDVKIILDEDATLDATKGIEVGTGSRLTIDGKGTLNVNANGYATGIGADLVGAIVIDGGKINVTGGNYRAGIGGQEWGDESSVTINGGVVNATGGEMSAGIGSGYGGHGGNVVINGGTVTATGGIDAAGIGGGKQVNGGSITITGGTVTANAGSKAAGIGGGRQGDGGSIVITGGKVTANAGANGYAGIGHGDPDSELGNREFSASLTLGWTKDDNSVYASSYSVDSIVFTKQFYFNGFYNMQAGFHPVTATMTVQSLNGMTLYPYLGSAFTIYNDPNQIVHKVDCVGESGVQVFCSTDRAHAGETVTVRVFQENKGPSHNPLFGGFKVSGEGFDDMKVQLRRSGDFSCDYTSCEQNWFNDDAWGGEATGTFTMPATPVTVKPTFLTFGSHRLYLSEMGWIKNFTLPLGEYQLTVYDEGRMFGSSGRSKGTGAIVLTAPEGYSLQVRGSCSVKENRHLSVFETETKSRMGSCSMLDKNIQTDFSQSNSITIEFELLPWSWHTYTDEGSDFELTVYIAKRIPPAATYSITYAEGIVGGADSRSEAGKTVTFTVNPPQGYMLDSIEIKDETGKPIVEANGTWWHDGNNASFTMPATNVTVTPKFVLVKDASVNMPLIGVKKAKIPVDVTSFKVYDDGGNLKNYSSGSDGTLTLQAPEGYLLSLSGTVDLADANDILKVYDGDYTVDNSASLLMGKQGAKATIPTVQSTGREMTFVFVSDNAGFAAGLDLTVNLVLQKNSITYAEGVSGKTEAVMGETIMVTAVPPAGKVLSEIEIKNADGDLLDFVLFGNTVTFEMAASSVTVTPVFVDKPEDEYYETLPCRGTKKIMIPPDVAAFRLHGDLSELSHHCESYLVMSAPEGYILQMSGTLPDPESNRWHIFYDGDSLAADTLLKIDRKQYVQVYSTGPDMKLHFIPHTFFQDFDLMVTLIKNEFAVSITDNVAGGLITCDKAKARYGEKVSCNTTPKDGFYFYGFDVTGENYAIYEISSKVEFDMPPLDVTVTPLFTDNPTAEGGLYVNMPVDIKKVMIPVGVSSFKVYDDGGKDGPLGYEYNCIVCNNIGLELVAPEEYVLKVKVDKTTPKGDLYVYDGDYTKGIQFDNNRRDMEIGDEVISSGQTLILRLYKNTFLKNDPGFELTVELIWKGSSITCADNVKGGSMVCDKTQAAHGKKVSFDVKPDEGYYFWGFDVTGENYDMHVMSSELEFEMPPLDVTVTPLFADNLTIEGGLYVNMPSKGNQYVTVPSGVTSFKVYDDGGKDGKASQNSDGYLAITAPDGYLLKLDGKVFGNHLVVYDGETSVSNPLIDLIGDGSILVYSTGSLMTLYFGTDGTNSDGIDMNVTLVKNEFTVAVADNVQGGTIICDKVNAKHGEKVSCNVTPKEGFFFYGIDVTGENYAARTGSMLSSDVSFDVSFDMPPLNATVTPLFTDNPTAESGLYVNMPSKGMKYLTVPPGVTSFKLYDDGGKDGSASECNKYSSECTADLVLTAPEGYGFVISGDVNSGTWLYVCSGEDVCYDGSPKKITKASTASSGEEYFTTERNLSLREEYNYGGSIDMTVTVVPIYTITYADGVIGNVIKAKAGDTVKLKIAPPPEGYWVARTEVKDDKGNLVDVVGGTSWYSEGRWCLDGRYDIWPQEDEAYFYMPSSNVTISPVFTDDISVENNVYIKMTPNCEKKIEIYYDVTSFKVYDDGGKDGAYSNGHKASLELYTSLGPQKYGHVIELSGSVDLGNGNDYFIAYDDFVYIDDLADYYEYRLFDNIVGSASIPKVRALQGYTTLYFESDDEGNADGLDLTVNFVQRKYPITYDEGISGDKVEVLPGDLITLTSTPPEGQSLNDVQATIITKNRKGSVKQFTLNMENFQMFGNTASFTMPLRDSHYSYYECLIKITPVFKDIGSESFIVTMPKTGVRDITIPDGVSMFNIHGSKEGDHRDYASGTLMLTAPGYLFRVTGNANLHCYWSSSNGTYKSNDTLMIYDGETDGQKIVNTNTNCSESIDFFTKGDVMTLHFASGISGSAAGLDLAVTLFPLDSNHSVTCVEAVEGGTFSCNKQLAKYGDVVTVDATPDEGYALTGFRVYGSALGYNDGYDQVIETLASTKSSFTMPYGNVTVWPKFSPVTADEAFYVTMPQSGTKKFTVPEGMTSFKVYDDGGKDGEFCTHCEGYLVLTPPEGYVLELSGSIDALYYDYPGTEFTPAGAYLTVFDGTSDGKMLIDKFHSTVAQLNAYIRNGETQIPTVYSSNGKMTLYFRSYHHYNHHDGLDLTVNVVKKDLSITCANNVSGGSVQCKKKARAGELITLAATPADGFVFEGVEIKDENQKTIEMSSLVGNVATFLMPKSNVTVTPVFAKATVATGENFVNMPCRDTRTVELPSGLASLKVYDDGGKLGDYGTNCNGYLTIVAPEGYSLQLEGTSEFRDRRDRGYSVPDGDCDFSVYDGQNTVSYPLIDRAASGVLPSVNSSGRNMTLYFFTHGVVDNMSGLDITVKAVKNVESHSVVCNNSGEGGTAVCDKSRAVVGENVTMNVTPAQGYLYYGYQLYGTSANENFERTALADGWFVGARTVEFDMVSSDISVTPLFTDKHTAEEGLTVVLPVTGTRTVYIPEVVTSFKVIDDPSNQDKMGSLVLIAPMGYVLEMSGTIRGWMRDYLDVFEGKDFQKLLLHMPAYYDGKYAYDLHTVPTVRSTGRTITLKHQLEQHESQPDLETIDLTVRVIKSDKPGIITITEANGKKQASIDGEYSGTDVVEIGEDITVDHVTFNRKFIVDLETGGYTTLMLPFSVSTEYVGGLGGVYKFAYVDDCDGDKKDDVCINKVWEDSDTKHQTLEANVPYLVKMAEPTLKINTSVTLKATLGGTLYDIRKQTEEAREGSWQMRGVFGYKKWQCGDEDMGKVWGYAGEPRNDAKIGKFVHLGKGVWINPFRAYLYNPNGETLNCTDGSKPQSIAASPYAKAYTAEFLPAPARSDASATASSEVASVDGFGGMQVVVVDDDNSTSGERPTVIGRFNPATGEIRMLPRTKQTYDLKGRRVNGEKKNARGAYYGKKSRK